MRLQHERFNRLMVIIMLVVAMVQFIGDHTDKAILATLMAILCQLLASERD